MKVKKLKKKLSNMVEFAEFLKNPSPKVKVPLYTEEEVEQRTTNSRDDTMNKPTLSQRMDKLAELMNSRFDNLEKDINSLKQDVKDINARLDYIVSANNLKDSPKAKSK